MAGRVRTRVQDESELLSITASQLKHPPPWTPVNIILDVNKVVERSIVTSIVQLSPPQFPTSLRTYKIPLLLFFFQPYNNYNQAVSL